MPSPDDIARTSPPGSPARFDAWLARRARWVVAVAAGAYFVTLLKSAWLSDDYFITLRSVEHLFAGHGIRFNLYERSFLTTSVAYFFLLLPLRLVTADPFVLHGLFALTCNAVLLWLLWKLAREHVGVWLLGVGLLFASKAYFDYSWFGQENPLGHALVAALAWSWLRLHEHAAHPPGSRPTPAAWRSFVALAALAPLYRHDFVLLAWPLAMHVLWGQRVHLGVAGVCRTVCWMLAPLGAWTLFSLVYFGFPLPASAYAKLPEPFGLVHRLIAAWDYYRFSLHKDAVMMAVLFGSQLLWLGRPHLRIVAAALALAMAYIVAVGADYMGGRFFTVPYVLMVALLCGTGATWREYLTQRLGRARRSAMLGALAAGLAAWAVLWPHAPATSAVIYRAPVFDAAYPSGIANERAAHQPETGVTVWWDSMRTGGTYPDDMTARLGILLGRAERETFYVCNLGMTPYMARLEQSFLDILGLADRFMAALPALTWRPGHYERVRPAGLAQSLASGTPAFADAGLNRYFEILRNVTAGEPLLTTERFRHIVALNLGMYDSLLKRDFPEPQEAAAAMAREGGDSILAQVLGIRPDDAAVYDRLPPQCRLIHDPDADMLLRRRIP